MTKFSHNCLLKILYIGILLSFFQFSVSAQESNLNQQQSAVEQTASENQKPYWGSQNGGQTVNSPSTFGLFFKMVFALALVTGIAYFALRVLKRSTKLSNSDDPFLRHVSHLSLSPSRSVDVVTILDHAYILGVSDNNVNLVGEITDKELVNSMNLYADKNDSTKRPRSFEDVLNIFMGKMSQNPSKKNNIYGSAAWDSSESLRRQRERFNENEDGEQ
ncbi:FliO/MopB family protein [Treponema sp.]|uniref:FliO/MopB family protein n=1 Tax=Treponema sp. TaxID=166 RepID=UPI00388E2B0A